MTTTKPPTRRDLRIERRWLPVTVDQLVALRRAVVEIGYSPMVASGLVGWLVAKGAGDPDPASAPTRAQYRKILAELAAQQTAQNPRSLVMSTRSAA